MSTNPCETKYVCRPPPTKQSMSTIPCETKFVDHPLRNKVCRPSPAKQSMSTITILFCLLVRPSCRSRRQRGGMNGHLLRHLVHERVVLACHHPRVLFYSNSCCGPVLLLLVLNSERVSLNLRFTEYILFFRRRVGKVVIINLFSPEVTMRSYHRPVTSVALHPVFGNKTMFATGGKGQQFIINTKVRNCD